MKRFSIILLVVLSISFTQSNFAQNTFRLGYVKGNTDGTDLIWLANTKKKNRVAEKAVAILGHTFDGVINLNGRDIKLRMLKDYMPDKNFKVGRGGYQIWKGKNTIVRLDYIFTWLCPPKNEQCEVYYYKGSLDIAYNQMRRKVKITGFGGS